MRPLLSFILLFVLAFLSGTIPTAYLIGKAAKNIDIRNVGSGNVGATNAFRVLGKGWGITVFLLDFLKGFLPFFLISQFYSPASPERVWSLWVSSAAIFGHIFNPFLAFKGGKGVATGSGLLFAYSPLLFLSGAIAWAAIFSLTKVVSVSSLVSAFFLIIIALFMKVDFSPLLFLFLLLVLVVWTHRSNIQRLLKGKESRLR